MDRKTLVDTGDDNRKYREVRAVNNSALGYFIESPLAFKTYYDNQIEERGDWYDIGDAVHCIILQPELFDDKFVIFDYKKPASEQQKLFCDTFVKNSLIDERYTIYDAYAASYKADNKSEKKINEAAETIFQELANYIQFTRMGNEKTVLSTHSMNVVKNCVGSLMANPKADLVVKTPDTPSEYLRVYNELEIYFDYKSLPCKSKIDRLIVDKKERKVYIIDFKTTSKKIHEFKDSFNKYNYERQFAFYAIAVFEFLDKQTGIEGLADYEVQFLCPIVTTKEPFESRIFTIPVNKIQVATGYVKSLLEELDWHFNTGNWNYPKCYYEGTEYELLDY